MTNWVKFTSLKQRSVDTISITASNTFNFPRKFYDDNQLANFNFVTIYYDKVENSIGFNFNNNDEEKYKFKIQKNENGFGGFISATSFFKSNNIDVVKFKGRYDPIIEEVPEIGKLFVIKLKNDSEELKVSANPTVETTNPQAEPISSSDSPLIIANPSAPTPETLVQPTQ